LESLNDFEGRLGKKLKNSLGIKALVFLGLEYFVLFCQKIEG
jgi:hypothetical protein